jgi:hypothetical protein
MSYHQLFGSLATLVALLCVAPYYRGILKKETHPHVFSWLIWGLVMGITFAAQLVSHAGPGAWPEGVGALNCFIIAALSLKYGEKKITVGDWLSLGIAISTIPLWAITKNPLYSVIILATIDTVGYYPTLRKSWNDPHGENMSLYLWGILACILSVIALESFAMVNWITSLLAIFSNSLVITVLLTRRKLFPKN